VLQLLWRPREPVRGRGVGGVAMMLPLAGCLIGERRGLRLLAVGERGVFADAHVREAGEP
jgi:hypothetical protein